MNGGYQPKRTDDKVPNPPKTDTAVSNRSHGHWKIWGWSLTCSVCGHVGEGGDYCDMCGSIMDEPEVWWCPPIHLTPLIIRTCPSCGETVYGAVNYCKYCGAELGTSEVIE